MHTLSLSLPNNLITINPAASQPECFAVEQLAYYLALITGNRFTVAQNDTLQACEALAPGAYRFVVSEHEAKLFAAEPLALLHAVYHLLEVQAGCCWLAIWEGGEIIPRCENFSLTPMDETHVPAFSHRAFTNYPDINRDTVQMVDWMAKNRFNRFMIFANVEGAFEKYKTILRDELLVRGMKVMFGHHSFKYWLPPAEKFVTHPQWFAMVNNERIADGQICTSNPEVIDWVAQRIAKFFDDNPEIDTVGLWPNDCFGWCECPNCTALEPQRESAFYPPFASRTDTYLQFVNEVAKCIAISHPDRLLDALAYINYVEPPTIEVAENISVCFAPFNRCLKHPLIAPDDCTRPNNRYAECFQQWRKQVKGELYLFGYLMQIDMLSIPFRITEMLSEYFQWLETAGNDGYVMEFKPCEWGIFGINAHLIGQLSWQPNLDLNTFLTWYYQDIYGPAATAMAKFWQTMHDLFVEPGPCVYHYDLTYTTRATHELLTPALVQLAEARMQAAQGEPRHRECVEQAHVGVEWLIRMGSWQRTYIATHEAFAEGSVADANKREILRQRVCREMDELLTWARTHNKFNVLDLEYIESRVKNDMTVFLRSECKT